LEKELFQGQTHVEFGAALLSHWGLPVDYDTAVAHQRDRDYRGDNWPIVLTLILADQLRLSDFATVDEDLLATLGLDMTQIQRVETAYRAEMDWVNSFAAHL
jgi:HD-like signal output (HDOD) protein